MTIIESTASYEDWLGRQLEIVPQDLEQKHATMAQSAFPFLRATFYRFVQAWKDHAGNAVRAPKVLAVGDLHVANFGTWRDVEGRLVWGINDFDEVYPFAYTIDLVRLAVSAHIAADENHLAVSADDACNSILAGYQAGIASGGCPFILAEQHKWLRDTVTGGLRDPVAFWAKMDQMGECAAAVPKDAMRGIDKLMPVGAEVERIGHRVAGLGSLGRQRFVALAHLNGSRVAREAKALCASATLWAGIKGGSNEPMYPQVLEMSIRALDPFVRIKRAWIVRRLAPYCSRVDLSALPKEREESKLLHAMGFETANVHLGTKGAAAKIAADLKKRPAKWLHHSAQAMKSAVLKDFEAWRTKHQQASTAPLK
jgi:hypothetical protein